ncbi:hypothetical protein [Paenibacillus sp. y28]|uniref:hypothetical protein n=1 Tax=Paenibacillus sp. y28 TaxID=3129110 RepID=UPI00301AA5C0
MWSTDRSHAAKHRALGAARGAECTKARGKKLGGTGRMGLIFPPVSSFSMDEIYIVGAAVLL